MGNSMPDLFYARTKIMRWISISQLVNGILLAVSCAIIFDCVYSKGPYQTYLVFGTIAVINLIILIFCYQYFRKTRGADIPYSVPLSVGSIQDIVSALIAEEVENDSYVSFCKVEGINIRTLIQYAPKYDKSTITAQRKNVNKLINRSFHISHSVPMYEALSSIRINLVVCDSVNDQLLKWVSQNTERFLSRNEAIVSVAITLEDKIMYFPAFFSNVLWNQAKRYEVAGVFLSERLARKI